MRGGRGGMMPGMPGMGMMPGMPLIPGESDTAHQHLQLLHVATRVHETSARWTAPCLF